MKRQGIVFEQGLNMNEFADVEKIYGITIPNELKDFYKIAIPVSKGFYNWRDFSSQNVMRIKEMVEMPAKMLLNDINSIGWIDKWGEEPSDKCLRQSLIQDQIESAPKLIPVFFHRYIADTCKSPVFSICGLDIIIYAKELNDYLLIEFCKETIAESSTKAPNYVPFWSDIIEAL